MSTRTCDCPHPYPVCTCAEGHRGAELVRRSKFASSLAGWPGPMRAAAVVPQRTAPAVGAGGRDHKIRVGIVSPGCHVGGAERWMVSLLQWLDRDRIDAVGVAVLYSQHVNARMAREFREHAPLAVGPEGVDRLYAGSDIVLIWGVSAWENRLPDRPRHCAAVLVSHGTGEWTARVFGRPEQADAWAAVSGAALAPIPEAVRSRAVIIPNCYDPARVVATPAAAADARRKWGVEAGRKVLGYLGRISDEKNPAALLAAIEALPRDWVGVLVGAGDGHRALWERVRQSPAADRVILAGAVDHPGAALATFDALLLPSHEEACSITLLEAWAAGVPVVATPVGTVLERPSLVRGVPMNPSGDAIAEAVLADRRDPEGTRLRVRLAQDTVRREYSPERFGRAWTDFLSSVHRAARPCPTCP